MAYQVCGNQLVVILAQVVVKAGNLAGTAGIEHILAPIQSLFGLPVGKTGVALHILGLFQGQQLLLIPGCCMVNALIIRGIPGTEYHASLLQHPVCHQGEHSAGGAFLPHRILRPHRIALGGRMVRNRMLHRANLPALAAVNAQFLVYLGKQKTLGVQLHGNGVLGAGVGAGSAAGAFVMGNFQDCVFHIIFPYIFPIFFRSNLFSIFRLFRYCSRPYF